MNRFLRVTPFLALLTVTLGGGSVPAVAAPLVYSTFDAPFVGAKNVIANGLNSAGTLVGRYDNNGTHGFVLAQGVFTALNVPGASYTVATGINDKDAIIGYYADQRGQHGFRFAQGAYRTLADVPGALNTLPAGLNNAGQIVVQYQDSNRFWHGAVSTENTYIALNVPGALNTYAQGIDDSGRVVGQYEDNSHLKHGFAWSGGTFKHLDVPFPGASTTGADGTNNAGTIVGSYVDANRVTHGFVETKGVFTKLDAPFTGYTNSVPNAISNNGQVAGSVQTNDHREIGFYTGAAGWPQNGQPPAALAGTWDWSSRDLGLGYRLTRYFHLVLHANGTYELLTGGQKASSGGYCANGLPDEDDYQEHDFGTFAVQNRRLVLTAQTGSTFTHTVNCTPSLDQHYSTAGNRWTFLWEVGVSPQQTTLWLLNSAYKYPDNNLVLKKQ
jgi:uncharacterized membrane protein